VEHFSDAPWVFPSSTCGLTAQLTSDSKSDSDFIAAPNSRKTRRKDKSAQDYTVCELGVLFAGVGEELPFGPEAWAMATSKLANRMGLENGSARRPDALKHKYLQIYNRNSQLETVKSDAPCLSLTS